ncbi:MAG: hypothetical protein KAS63_02185 [Candidatus Heimdallarchaeota archaeon]|nr:hypothetical protein [Candidatus Heimdallarchaeota archaeon]MCK4954145.1 hypothetical protein [Candidatus Heimdallarchaeota archaeon]
MNITFSGILKSLVLPFVWIVGIVLYLAVVMSKFIFLLYETLIPRGLRELVPILNLWRKYLVYISNLFSSQEKIEVIKIEEEFEEIIQKEDRINKAYPLQRGVGETYDHLLIVVVIILASIVLIQSSTTDFNALLDAVISRVPWFQTLSDRSLWLVITVIAMICSTVMGILSFIATVFGPIYALFHRSSLRMVKVGAYRFASYYQKFEDFFSLPYIASKASFSFFDAPPISSETYEEFKIDLIGDLHDLSSRFTNILSLNPKSLPEKTKSLYKELLSSKIEDRLDMTQVEDSISRAFALEIWQKETSLMPWKKEPGLATFAERRNISYKEAKQTLEFVTSKLSDKFVSKPFYSSILLTGALKGVLAVENRYKMPLSDLEYNQLAFTLALGAQRYLIDHHAKPRFRKRLRFKLKNLSYGLVVVFVELYNVIINYAKHIWSNFRTNFSRGWSKRAAIFFGSRFTEIQKTLFSFVFPGDEIEDIEEKKQRNEAIQTLKMLWKAFLFLFKVILALPMSLYYFAKLFSLIFINIAKFCLYHISRIKSLKRFQKYLTKKKWMIEKEEKVKKKNFEKDLALESMVSMYDEIYSKMVLETYYYT